MKISLIAAVANNGVIGRNNELPWRLRDDLRFFAQQDHGAPRDPGPQELRGHRSLPAAPPQPRDLSRSLVPRGLSGRVQPGASARAGARRGGERGLRDRRAHRSTRWRCRWRRPFTAPGCSQTCPATSTFRPSTRASGQLQHGQRARRRRAQRVSVRDRNADAPHAAPSAAREEVDARRRRSVLPGASSLRRRACHRGDAEQRCDLDERTEAEPGFYPAEPPRLGCTRVQMRVCKYQSPAAARLRAKQQCHPMDTAAIGHCSCAGPRAGARNRSTGCLRYASSSPARSWVGRRAGGDEASVVMVGKMARARGWYLGRIIGAMTVSAIACLPSADLDSYGQGAPIAIDDEAAENAATPGASDSEPVATAPETDTGSDTSSPGSRSPGSSETPGRRWRRRLPAAVRCSSPADRPAKEQPAVQSLDAGSDATSSSGSEPLPSVERRWHAAAQLPRFGTARPGGSLLRARHVASSLERRPPCLPGPRCRLGSGDDPRRGAKHLADRLCSARCRTPGSAPPTSTPKASGAG